MTILPEPPAATTAGQTIPTDADREQAARWLAALDQLTADQPTAVRVDDPAIPSWKDGPRIGDAPPVPQDDKRIVPAWAAGIAVASIGVGAGITGVGCGAWLVLQGLASVTLNSVLMVTLPFAGLAMAITAIGGLIKSLSGARVTNHHHYNAPVDQRHVHSSTRGVWAKNTNQN